MFYIDRSRDFAVAQIPRAGLYSIHLWLWRDAPVGTNEEAKEVSRRIVFVRNPIDRLVSAYSLIYWMKSGRDMDHVNGAPNTSWAAFVDHVLDNQIPDDEHWLPQVDHIGDAGNEFYKFENIATIYESVKRGILPMEHVTTSRPPDVDENYRRTEVDAKYAADIALWESL